MKRAMKNYDIDDECVPDYAALAKEATDKAVAALLAAGIPVVFMANGVLIRHFPDGHEERVTNAEIREVSGGSLP